MLGLGTIFYVALLLINAMAVLNEERFLARSESVLETDAHSVRMAHSTEYAVGWTSNPQQMQHNAYQQPYDAYTGMGAAPPDVGVKGKLVNLIGAVRTLMRGTKLDHLIPS